MTTETIDIVVRENGARVVKRALEDIGATAERSVRGLRLLQNALFVLGGAGLLSGLVRLLDTLTNFENRLTLVTRSSNELNAVQEQLFNVAARTRTSFESTSEIFTRTALAVRELGLSQQQTLDFTESLNQATILSGASTREAGAALIQLSQGLASGRLNGDELRSVLEQLPFVADIIANSLGVTRGQLRELGSQGQITSAQIVKAFQDSREEIAEKFAKTIPTISQAFSVLRTEFLRVLDKFDDFTGGSAAVAFAIIGIANSLSILVGGLVAAAAAFGAFKLIGYVSALVNAIKINRELAAAVAAGNATLLTATGIEKAKAASALQVAAADSVAASAKVRDIQLGIVQLTQNAAILRQQQADAAFTVVNGRARSALTGRFVALSVAVENNIRTNRALILTENALAASKVQVSAAITTQTAALTGLAAAQGRATAANVAAASFTSRLTAAFPLLGGAISLVSRALAGLWALMLANPVGAVIAAIVAVVAALAFFSDSIGVADDGLVTLRDVAVATFQLIGEFVAPLTNFISDSFSTAISFVSDRFNAFIDFIGGIFNSILQGAKFLVNSYIGLWVGLVNAIIKAFGIIPAALKDLGAIAVNGLIDVVKGGIEGIVAAIGNLLEFIGGAAELIGQENPFAGYGDNFEFTALEGFKQEVTGAASQVGSIINEEFSNALSTDYVGNAWGAILERARLVAAERLANLDAPGTETPLDPNGTGGGGGGASKTFADIIREMTIQNELLRVGSAERERLNGIMRVESELKRALTESERELVLSLLEQNQVLTAAAEIYDALNEPAEKYRITLAALNELLQEGRIDQDQFTQSLRSARIEFLNGQTDAASGLERGILKILEKTGDFAGQMEEIVTSAFDGMSSAIADLVVDGEADFAGLIRSINKQIVQLVVSQAFQQLFGGFAGFGGSQNSGGSSLFSGLFQGLGSLLGFQNGGSFQVGSNTGIAPIPGVDNRLVAFRAQDGENVTVTPKGQSPGGTQQSVTVNFNISTPDVQSFRNSESQLSTRAARMISRASRNS